MEITGILCISKDFSDSMLDYYIALRFEIDSDTMKRLMNMETWSETDFVYFMDTGGEIVYRVNYEGEPLTEETLQSQKTSINDQKYTLLHAKTESCGLTAVVGVSNRTIEQGFNNVNQVIWLYIGASIVCMVIFCIYWAAKRAVSMREVQEKIAEIQKSMADSMLEKLLLRGAYSARELEDINNSLHWDMEFFCVVCVSTRLECEEDILALFCRSDAFFEKHFSCISASVEMNERVYIIQMPEEGAPDTKTVEAVAGEMAQSCDNIWMGISSIGTGLENIHLCYQQARLVVRQNLDKYDSCVAVYHEQSDGSNKLFKLNLNSPSAV